MRRLVSENIPVNFNEAENYLLSLGNEVATMKLGLDSVTMLFAELGDPQKKYFKVQVAGTNGKGSVCAFLNSICVRAGIRTGMYTSPHLISITERIQIDGTAISQDEFARLATVVRSASEALVDRGGLESVPTFFEQVTAIAVLAFAEAKVELAILETGLGGRLDATTAANAEIAAITRIDIDHQKYLGETLKEIAAEKAAIIHSESKVIALHQSREVDSVIKGRCREVGVEPAWATDNISIKRERDLFPQLIATFVTERANYPDVLLWEMHGRHQVENAAVAIGVAELLRDSGFNIDPHAVAIGLETAKHPGRLEWIGRYLLDGAHNTGGAKALRNYLDDSVPQDIVIVFGSMDDKNVGEITDQLFPKAKSVILTRPDNSRAISPDVLLGIVAGTPNEISVTSNVSEALAEADKAPADAVILVTGSLYLVGEARKILLARSEQTEN
jgi:dihydrofolate synthase/folylpolyglutamate synthase